MKRWEYCDEVLSVETKSFSMTLSGALKGLSQESRGRLATLGREGWELVALMPFLTPNVETTTAVGVFKRERTS